MTGAPFDPAQMLAFQAQLRRIPALAPEAEVTSA